MRRMQLVLPIVTLAFAACDKTFGPAIEAPANLRYRLEPSGDPEVPSGLVLEWDAVSHPDLEVYNIYSRPAQNADYALRGSTTSRTFHDIGVPDLEYYVTAVHLNGDESDPSAAVLIDERLRLEAPAWLNSISLNGAVHLYWSDNPFTTAPTGFRLYRVYSSSYSLDDNLCGTAWSLEGTTVSPEFLASVLTNGEPRCFGVSAESVEGWESLWSPLRGDTPRPDARNVLMYPYQADPSRSGFRFFQDANGDGQAGALELGIVASGDLTTIDFWLDRDVNGDVFIVPERAGTEVALYSTDPIADLTSIDIAPEGGYARTGIQAVPGFGYVFRMSDGDQFARFGAVRITHASNDFVIFDWSYQTDPGNPELSVRGGLATFGGVVPAPKRP